LCLAGSHRLRLKQDRACVSMNSLPGWLGAGLLAPVVDLNEVGPLGAARQVNAGQRAACPIEKLQRLAVLRRRDPGLFYPPDSRSDCIKLK
jgi:hypothetical protein